MRAESYGRIGVYSSETITCRRGYHPEIDRRVQDGVRNNLSLSQYRYGLGLPLRHANCGMIIDEKGFESILGFDSGHVSVYNVLNNKVCSLFVD